MVAHSSFFTCYSAVWTGSSTASYAPIGPQQNGRGHQQPPLHHPNHHCKICFKTFDMIFTLTLSLELVPRLNNTFHIASCYIFWYWRSYVMCVIFRHQLQLAKWCFVFFCLRLILFSFCFSGSQHHGSTSFPPSVSNHPG